MSVISLHDEGGEELGRAEATADAETVSIIAGRTARMGTIREDGRIIYTFAEPTAIAIAWVVDVDLVRCYPLQVMFP